jgi:hypothetical protein
MPFTVYGLFDPLTGELRYVGKTILALPKRLAQHMYEARRKGWGSHRVHWINSLLQQCVKPEIDTLQTCDDAQDLSWWERWHIAYWPGVGADLTNNSEGGEGGHYFSAETRQKISIALKGRPHDAERKRKISETTRGRRQDRVIVEKRAAAIRGRKQTPEHIEKRTAHMFGRKPSAETRKRMSDAAKKRSARGHSPESRKKISDIVRAWHAARRVQKESA